MAYEHFQDGPDIKVLRQSTVTVKKDYECCACHQTILKGDKCVVIVFKDDNNKFQYDRYHYHCPNQER